MANPVLHIKDSYYFEVPKVLYPSDFKSVKDFPDVWIKLDPEFQEWEFDRLYERLIALQQLRVQPKGVYSHLWHEFVHADPANHGKPFDVFAEEVMALQQAEFEKRRVAEMAEGKRVGHKEYEQFWKEWRLDEFLGKEHSEDLSYPEMRSLSAWLYKIKTESARNIGQQTNTWDQIRHEAGDIKTYKTEAAMTEAQRQEAEAKTEKTHTQVAREWSPDKIKAYNYHLSGKILIPQPFGELRNLHEKEPGLTNLCISKFMVIEVVVALILIAVFGWLGRKVAHGAAPKGKIWNLLEAFVVFIRDQIAEPSIGHHHAHQYTPYLWTVFFFVLGCNLMGLIPWVGAPTGAFATTSALALLTFGMVVAGGMREFGFFGFFKNIVPHMDLPWYIAILIIPMLWVIEAIGLLVKHAVLAIRLLANMVAGHLVLLGLMAIAFSVEAVAQFGGNNFTWSIAAVISVLACTAFSMMELFVAFLQAYVFTFLSALFIGSVLHEH